jgi:hypothetical protein
MQAQPLNKKIYEKALALGIVEINLNFQGGNDEGYLYVHCLKEVTDDNGNVKKGSESSLDAEIEEWAWTVYSYSGAGEGSDYGDNIVYDLKDKTITTQEWYHTAHYDDPEEQEFALEEA